MQDCKKMNKVVSIAEPMSWWCAQDLLWQEYELSGSFLNCAQKPRAFANLNLWLLAARLLETGLEGPREYTCFTYYLRKFRSRACLLAAGIIVVMPCWIWGIRLHFWLVFQDGREYGLRIESMSVSLTVAASACGTVPCFKENPECRWALEIGLSSTD